MCPMKKKISKLVKRKDDENHRETFFFLYLFKELIMVKHCLTTTTNDDNDEDPMINEPTDLSSWSHFHPLWTNLLQKTFDPTYKCHSNYLDAHPAITTKMRSVLCDWLIEVKKRKKRFDDENLCVFVLFVYSGFRSLSSSSRNLSFSHCVCRSIFV